MSNKKELFFDVHNAGYYNDNHFKSGFLSDSDGIVHAHSIFNYCEKNSSYNSNTVYISILSTFHAYIRGHVETILWEEECQWYAHQSEKIETIRWAARIVIAQIITLMPDHVEYAVIPCSQKRTDALKSHYCDIGQSLKSEGLIKKSWHKDEDSIYYVLSRR